MSNIVERCRKNRCPGNTGCNTNPFCSCVDLEEAADYILELEAKLAAAESQSAVPEGFVLVPEEMIDAGLGTVTESCQSATVSTFTEQCSQQPRSKIMSDTDDLVYIKELEAKLAAAEADAARYRWWVQNAWFYRATYCLQPAWPKNSEIGVGDGQNKKEAVDAAIDAARGDV